MLDVNDVAPDFTLPELGNGESHFYADATANAVLVFYKFSCGTSRFALPFLQKIYDMYGDTLYFRAIAQDDAEATKKLQSELGISLPTLLDLPPYSVSSQYGLHTVPSLFLMDPSRRIHLATHGFVKQDFLNLADILAEKSGRPQLDLFDQLDVPEIKPG